MATAGWRSSSRVTSKPAALGAAILAGLGSGLFAGAVLRDGGDGPALDRYARRFVEFLREQKQRLGCG